MTFWCEIFANMFFFSMGATSIDPHFLLKNREFSRGDPNEAMEVAGIQRRYAAGPQVSR
jgi:hypothetical protein